MLIRFTVKNFKSFWDEQSLSMVKGRESRLPHHINADETGGFKTLRGAVLYGSNASGKSNLIEAIRYAQNFIVHNHKGNTDLQFRLDAEALKSPSSFDFEFKIDNKAFSYGFESKGKEVVREWLYEIDSSGQDRRIFERFPKTGDKADIKFGERIKKEIKLTKDTKDWNDIEAIARTTPDDTLFLYDSKKRNLKFFLKQFKWFEKKLRILSPESIEPFFTEDDAFIAFLTKVLKAADTGISEVRLQKEDDFSKIKIPPEIKERIRKDLKNGGFVFIANSVGLRLVIKKDDNNLCVNRLVTVHKTKSGDEIEFDLKDESDGTRRLIDVAPAFFSCNASDRVLIIDELDRSLHPIITEMLHGAHFDNLSRINSQLILATHEHYLLSQEFYRRDEIWFVEKDNFGISKLYSLSEYKERHDKDIEKAYLLGRYGAKPNVRRLND